MNAPTVILPERNAGEYEPQDRHLPQGQANEPSHGNERVNILLVDDEPKNLTVLESILDDPSYRLVLAETVDQALLSLVEAEFAVIVLDIQMPQMSGFELAQMIKRRRKTANIPIIFLTAHYHEDRHILEGYQSGAVDYLLKPIDSAIVRSKIAVFVELYRKTRESLAINAALSAEIEERERVQQEMHQLYSQLEEKVAERTAELQAANSILQQMQADLREVDSRKDQFLAMLGHELRNPLAAICTAVSILQRLDSDKPDVKWCREIIERQSSHLTRLVDDLLDVSRVSRGKIQLDKCVLNFSTLVQQAIESCRTYVSARKHELILTLPGRPVCVNGDQTRLVQVVTNLVNNAAKYTDEGGHIWVTVEAGDLATVRVRDDGRGLEPNAIANLFELFYQADTNLDRADGGLGVGLALVKSIVQMHGGTVEAHSAGRGQGSEFIVRLPCEHVSDSSQSSAAGETQGPVSQLTPGSRLRILVVDDNVDAAQSLAKILGILGHETLVGFDAQAAMDLALRHRPDVLFLDIGLPGMSGYQLCESLRRAGLLDQRIIAVTGYGQESDRQLSVQAGFDVHLVKPVNLQMIEQVLADRAVSPNTQ